MRQISCRRVRSESAEIVYYFLVVCPVFFSTVMFFFFFALLFIFLPLGPERELVCIRRKKKRASYTCGSWLSTRRGSSSVYGAKKRSELYIRQLVVHTTGLKPGHKAVQHTPQRRDDYNRRFATAGEKTAHAHQHATRKNVRRKFFLRLQLTRGAI